MTRPCFFGALKRAIVTWPESFGIQVKRLKPVAAIKEAQARVRACANSASCGLETCLGG